VRASRMKRIAATAVIGVVALLGTAAGPAGAASSPPRGGSESTAVKLTSRDLEAARSLTSRVSQSIGADGQISSSLAARNGFSRSEIAALSSAPASSLAAAAARCPGSRYYKSGWTWAGYVYEAGLSSCDMNALTSGGQMLTAIATLIAVFGFAPAAIVAAVAAVGFSTLRWCNRNGTGSRIYYNNSATVAWCTQQ